MIHIVGKGDDAVTKCGVRLAPRHIAYVQRWVRKGLKSHICVAIREEPEGIKGSCQDCYQ